MTALASPTTSAGSKIAAIGAFRGENLVTNDEVAGPINSSDEWISQRTGINTRARAHPDTSVLDMAVAASTDALTKAGLQGSDIDVVLVSTVTHFHQTPALAPMVADLIGAGSCPAYDISAACAGYCYGVGQADALVRSGMAKHVLVVGVEKM